MAVNELGPTKTANFMYVQPFATLIVGYFLLSEPISIASIIGLVLIISGVYLTERVQTVSEIIYKIFTIGSRSITIVSARE
ncbi:EamA family transporter [Sphingobacterium thalpophilum]|uniref:EamA family transporter n=1 Tax=Sphingobacterium thalpophilum TaxID=259 RepID=UPI0037DA1561